MLLADDAAVYITVLEGNPIYSNCKDSSKQEEVYFLCHFSRNLIHLKPNYTLGHKDGTMKLLTSLFFNFNYYVEGEFIL